MPKIKYQECNFRASTLNLIEQCNEIIAEYIADGLRLTLRQLYYQLVSRDIIPNRVESYNKLGTTVSDARLAGLIDWDAIEDRTRNLESVSHWSNPSSIINSAAYSYRIDKWADQLYYPEVWIEKEALAGVFERICTRLDVPYLSCRGYTSQSEMWAAAMRFVKKLQSGKKVVVFHFGDHDPSGIDMTRDIRERLEMFASRHVRKPNIEIRRIALNMDQVEEYNPPENPAKSTDTRFQAYQDRFGDSSWELDALNPRVLSELVSENVKSVRDEDAWKDQLDKEARERALLTVSANHWGIFETVVEERWSDELEQEIETQKAENEE